MIFDCFTTKRLSVRDLRPIIDNLPARQAIENSLISTLTPAVLKYLPPPLLLRDRGVTFWLSERLAEGDVLLVYEQDTDELIGLMILASDLGTGQVPAVHIGYILMETSWGKGFATELLSGFVDSVRDRKPVKLVGGVDTANAASSRVLLKAGFERDPDLSRADVDMYVMTID